MIFGFNTDVKYGDTVYHVQSEARQNDLLLQTQVFVRGRCIGKHATSYAEEMAAGDFSEDQMHEMLKSQHRAVLDAVRGGTLESFFASNGPGTPEVQDVSAHGHGLVLQWANANAVYQDNAMVMQFAVTFSGTPVEGALVTSRLHVSSDDPIYSQSTTDGSGKAELKIILEESALSEAAVLVQATHGEHHATRKFRLKKAH